jgi:UDP-3-O-[3-hydroxymyristoyl] glucosamine N-acyltransferase
MAEKLSLVSGILIGSVICKKSDFDEIEANENVNYIFTSNPRLTFAKTISSFFQDKLSDDFTNDVQTHRLNKSIVIGENVFIGKNIHFF